MFGKISVGIEKMLKTPNSRIRNPKTAKVYGRRRASRTIHIIRLVLAPELGYPRPRRAAYASRAEEVTHIGCRRPVGNRTSHGFHAMGSFVYALESTMVDDACLKSASA